MNESTPGCSSGCESGWTIYLDQSNSNSESKFQKNRGGAENSKYRSENLEGGDEEDEDLSMVSDASSGPPHFREDEDCFHDESGGYFGYSSSENKRNNQKKKKIKEKSGKHHHHHLYLDDTASSPTKSHMVVPKSGSSLEHGTYYKGKSALQKHIGFFQSSISKKPSSGAAGGLQGRKWE